MITKFIKLILIIFVVILHSHLVMAFERGLVSINIVGNQTFDFYTEIASTPAQRSLGLMYRNTLPKGNGMLFDFKKPTIAKMWMKNTTISLDMLFINKNGYIIFISPNTTPLSKEIHSAKMPVRWVLELRAGIAEDLGINIGDHIKIKKD